MLSSGEVFLMGAISDGPGRKLAVVNTQLSQILYKTLFPKTKGRGEWKRYCLSRANSGLCPLIRLHERGIFIFRMGEDGGRGCGEICGVPEVGSERGGRGDGGAGFGAGGSSWFLEAAGPLKNEAEVILGLPANADGVGGATVGAVAIWDGNKEAKVASERVAEMPQGTSSLLDWEGDERLKAVFKELPAGEGGELRFSVERQEGSEWNERDASFSG